jgi:XTP/dITP diphosphohydrolase
VIFPERIAIASRNAHKLRELGRICSDWPVAWVTIENHEGPWPDVEEPHDSYRENALTKAREVATALGVPAIADDSGIEVDVLDGGPGPRSARFAGEPASDAANLARLIETIVETEPARRTARYRCVAAIAWPDGVGLSAEGACEGRLVSVPRGRRGFGYDPVFVPEGSTRTMAELADEEKDAISHRGRAFRALRALLADG